MYDMFTTYGPTMPSMHKKGSQSHPSLKQSTRHKTRGQLVTHRHFEMVNLSWCEELTVLRVDW